MEITDKTGRKYAILILAAVHVAVLIYVLVSVTGYRKNNTPANNSEGPEYIIPMSVHADSGGFNMRVIIRDCEAGSITMNLKKGNDQIASVSREISVTKQQGTNITLEPEEIKGDIPHDVCAEILLYAKANSNDKLNNEPIDRAVVNFKNYVVQLSRDTVYCVADAMNLAEKAELISGISADTKEIKIAEAMGASKAFEKYGIPSVSFAYGASGINAGDRTVVYPSASVIACTWNTAIAEKTGASIGRDAKYFNIDMVIAPDLNIQTDPLHGSFSEHYSESPLLTGYMGAAFINGIQSQGVGAAACKYTSYENSNISENAARELYMSGFELALKNSSPYAVYVSGNKMNILRNEWGYDGVLLYDTPDRLENIAEAALEADFAFSGGSSAANELMKAVQDGRIQESRLESSCVNILRAIVKTNSFSGKNGGILDTEAGAACAGEAASEGIVLLKNENNALPAKDRNVAVFGNAQIYTNISGASGHEAEPIYSASFINGFENAGFNTDKRIKALYSQAGAAAYASNTTSYSPGEITITEEDAAQAAKDNSFAVICISRQPVYGDGAYEAESFKLSTEENSLIDCVSGAFRSEGKTVTVIINTGNPIETVSWEDKADAILYTGYAGLETGSAAANIISGSINPSGKLAYEWPSYADTNDSAAYPFGYGLSYTSFEYTDVRASSNVYTDSISVSVNIMNTGPQSGKETVQLYICKPGIYEDANTEPVLAAFAKTDIIEPGESQKLTLVINNYSLRSYSEENSEWYIENGEYKAYLSSSEVDPGFELLRFKFEVEERIILKQSE